MSHGIKIEDLRELSPLRLKVREHVFLKAAARITGQKQQAIIWDAWARSFGVATPEALHRIEAVQTAVKKHAPEWETLVRDAEALALAKAIEKAKKKKRKK